MVESRMNYKNPKFNAAGSIDCEIEHPLYGWIPFTASVDDVEAYGKAVFTEINNAGGVLPYAPPPPYVPTAEDVRQQRDRLLAESDWTQLPDAQAALSDSQKQAWATYRQALRDVPQQSGFPADVQWPVKP